MDVIVSNLCWLPKSALSESDVFLLKKRLTLHPPPNKFAPPKKDEEGNYVDEIPRTIEMWGETPTHVGVPRAYFLANQRPKHVPVLRLPEPPKMGGFKSIIKLRPDDQEPVVQKIVEAFRSRGFFGGILQAYTGYGKTTTGIEIACRIGLRTLILVHKNALKEQWIERIRAFCPGASIGSIQGPNADWRGRDFVIGMMQSMMLESGEKYEDDMYDGFGLVICDEVHRCGSYAFSTVAPKFNAPYFLGLSATPKRKDGMDNAFKWQIGEVLAAPTDKNRAKPVIYVRSTGVNAQYTRIGKTGQKEYVDLNDHPKARLLNIIAKNKYRNGVIALDILKALKAGRSPLVMGERLTLLDCLGDIVREQAPKLLGKQVSVGYYVGGKSKEELDVAASCDIVMATVQQAQEGIDIEKLDTLFMATPVGDPVQIIGRIGRAKTVSENGVARVVPPKNRPMVVDYVDHDLKAFKGSYYSRIKHYKLLGFDIMGVKV